MGNPKLAAWRAGRTEEVALPSGLTVTARRITLEDVIMSGDIPKPLLGMIDKLAASAPQGLVLFAGEANARATIGGATEEWLNECKRRGLTTLTFGETAVIAAGSGAQATATLADQAGAAALYLLNKGHEVLVVYPEITRAESVAQAIGCAAMGLNVLVGQALPFWLTGGLNLLCAEALAGGRLLADPQGLRAAEALAAAVHSGQEA